MEKMSVEQQVFLASIAAEILEKNSTTMSIRYADAINQLIATTKELQDTIKQLQNDKVELSWKNSPDRSGGQFTQEEILYYPDRDNWS